MFYYLNGNLAVLEAGTAVIDCGGVGYLCNVSARTEAALAPSLNKPVKVFTHLSVREDAMELFGFADRSELAMFRHLISVSGVGAKTAIGVLGAVSPERIAYAVSVGDVKAIKAPGVGPKMAARIILELKDKIASGFTSESGSVLDGLTSAPAPKNNKLTEARTALVALGFSKTEAEGLMRKIDCTNLSVEEIIREALKQLNA